MAIAKIQKGDSVKVISGSYKGTVGQVLKIFKKKNAQGKVTSLRATVSNLPKIVKYQKANRAANLPGSQNEIDRKIQVSNLSLVTSNNEVSRVKIEEKDGKKVRVLKKDGSIVEKKADASQIDSSADTQKASSEKPKAPKKTSTKALSTKKSEQ